MGVRLFLWPDRKNRFGLPCADGAIIFLGTVHLRSAAVSDLNPHAEKKAQFLGCSRPGGGARTPVNFFSGLFFLAKNHFFCPFASGTALALCTWKVRKKRKTVV
jgi:hypothetical protein